MQVDGGKMSKSLGNTYTVSDLENKGYSPMEFRYFCLNTHYRKTLNFTFAAMDSAKISYSRLLSAIDQHKNGNADTDSASIEKYRNEFLEAIDDDVNIPLALGVMWSALKEAPSRRIYDLVQDFDRVLGLRLNTVPTQQKIDAPQEVIDLAEKRLSARKNKDWATSDELRDQIAALGYIVADKKDGYDIKKKP